MMEDSADKIQMKKIITAMENSFSPLEPELAERLGLSPEQFREMVLESESVEEFLDKLNSQKEVDNDESD